MPNVFEAQQDLPFPLEMVFAFFSNPENLPRLMPAWQKARIEEANFVPPPPPPAGTSVYRMGIMAGTGTRLTMTFRPVPLLPMRLPWEARIEDFRWNQGFCDVQDRGPFAYWRHCHTLTPMQTGERPLTRLVDHVEYELPLASMSGILNRIAVRPQMERIFRFRQRRTLELLGLLARAQA